MPTKVDLKIDWASLRLQSMRANTGITANAYRLASWLRLALGKTASLLALCFLEGELAPNLLRRYGLKQSQGCELVRIALKEHVAPVSQIMAVAIRFLKQQSPNLRLIVSFADQSQGHHGGIYQANNWIYTGTSEPSTFYLVNGRLRHPRSIGAMGLSVTISEIRKKLDPKAKSVAVPGKHRYLMPLNKKMRKQIIKLSKPYPKRKEMDVIKGR